jgi:hypothetical protein
LWREVERNNDAFIEQLAIIAPRLAQARKIAKPCRGKLETIWSELQEIVRNAEVLPLWAQGFILARRGLEILENFKLPTTAKSARRSLQRAYRFSSGHDISPEWAWKLSFLLREYCRPPVRKEQTYRRIAEFVTAERLIGPKGECSDELEAEYEKAELTERVKRDVLRFEKTPRRLISEGGLRNTLATYALATLKR